MIICSFYCYCWNAICQINVKKNIIINDDDVDHDDDDDDDDALFLRNVDPTKSIYALFAAWKIVSDSHHRKSPIVTSRI